MKRPTTPQEFIHWLELGAGARWVRLAAVLLVALLLSLRVAWTQFQGPANETVLVQADVGRQLARGEGFTTLVNFPQTAAVLEKRGQGFDATKPYPELHQAPLYSIVIAAGLTVLPEKMFMALFNTPPVPPDGFRVAVLMEYFDTSFRNVADVETKLKLPVLGVIPYSREPADEMDTDPAEQEPFRVLHTNINLALKPGQSNALVLFSAGLGEGKSTTLHRLTRLMAAGGERVLLIDSDLRRPTQHRLAQRPKEPGLSDLLMAQKSLDEVTQRAIAPKLDFIPSGSVAGFALSLLYVNRLRDLITELRGRYDKIIFDSPPIIGVSDASVLASVVDGAVLLIQHRRNPQSMVVRAQQIVEGIKTPLLGVVLSQVPTGTGEDYGYYTNNYSYYSEGATKPGRGASGRKTNLGNDERLHLSEPDPHDRKA